MSDAIRWSKPSLNHTWKFSKTFRNLTCNFGTPGEVLEGSKEDFLEDLKYPYLQRKFSEGFFFINSYNFGTNWSRMDLKYVLEWALSIYFQIIQHLTPEDASRFDFFDGFYKKLFMRHPKVLWNFFYKLL